MQQYAALILSLHLLGLQRLLKLFFQDDVYANLFQMKYVLEITVYMPVFFTLTRWFFCFHILSLKKCKAMKGNAQQSQILNGD